MVPQGSVATHMRCGGIFNKYFDGNLPEKLTVKKCENRLRINGLTAMNLVSPFFETRCISLLFKTISRFSRTPTCDGQTQTNRQTDTEP